MGKLHKATGMAKGRPKGVKNSYIRPDTRRFMLIPCLGPMIRVKGATNESLAKRAGVCARTVQNIRGGNKVIYHLGVSILEALHNNEFKRSPQGAK